MLQHLIRARSLLWLLVVRDFRARYAGSTLGVVWNLVHPIVLIAVYVLVFAHLMGQKLGSGGGALYVVHLCAGIVPWFLFHDVLSRSTTTLVDNASFLKKMAVPEEVLYLGVFVNALFTCLVSLGFLALMLTISGRPFQVEYLLAVPVVFALGLFALGVGMILSVLHLLMRDTGQIVSITLQLLFWSLPIVYVPSALPEAVRGALDYNPIRPYFALVQHQFGSPDAGLTPEAYLLAAILPFIALLSGLSFLRRNRAEILDQL